MFFDIITQQPNTLSAENTYDWIPVNYDADPAKNEVPPVKQSTQ
jgi:hypothetical protein